MLLSSSALVAWNTPQTSAPLGTGHAAGGGAPGAPEPLSLTTPAWARSHGDHKAVMLLVQFSDVLHNASNNWSKYNAIGNANGSTDVSLRTYFYENSAGNYTVNVTVAGWFNISQTMAHYSSGGGLADLVGDAALAADSAVDFSLFDEDGDDRVDNLIIIHAGGDQAVSGDPDDIYSETGTGTARTVDGVTVRLASIVAEDISTGSPFGILAHEFGHLAFDLPDLYDTDFNHAGVGEWDLMAFGGWGGGGANPNHMSAWTKYYLGWLTPYEPTYDVTNYTIYPSADPLWRNPIKFQTDASNEYFLVEFRYRNTSARYDSYLPTSGLVIYHVDDDVISAGWSANNMQTDASHKGLDIEEVGTQDMDQSWFNTGSTNDAWVSNATGFGANSTPNSNLYRNGGSDRSNLSVTNISSVNTTGVPHMKVSVRTGRGDFTISGQVQGGNQRTVLPGATANYTVLLTTGAVAGDSYNLSVAGLPAGVLASLNRSTMAVGPFGTGAVTLQVTVPAGCLAGESFSVGLRANSSAAPPVNATVWTDTTCEHVHGLSLSGPANLTLAPGSTAALNFTLTATGNGDEVGSLGLSANSTGLNLSSLNGSFAVTRGGSTTLTVLFSVGAGELQGTLMEGRLDASFGAANATLHSVHNVAVTVAASSGLRVSIGGVQPITLQPGVPLILDITVFNDAGGQASVSFTAAAPAWLDASFPGAPLLVPALSSATHQLTLTSQTGVIAGMQGLLIVDATSSVGNASAVATISQGQAFGVALTGQTNAEAPAGATVVVSLMAKNTGNGLDNATLEVTSVPSGWSAVPSTLSFALSAAGPGNQSAFNLSITVAPGAAGDTTSAVVVVLRSQSTGVESALQVNVFVTPSGGLSVTVQGVPPSMLPGESADLAIMIVNFGNASTFTVFVEGLPAGWSGVLNTSSVSLGPGAQANITLTLAVSPTAPAEVVTFRVSVIGGTGARVASVSVQVANVRAIAFQLPATLGPVAPGGTLSFNLTIENQGNAEELVQLSGTFAGGTLSFAQPASQVPGHATRTMVVTLVVSAASGPGNYAVDITGTTAAAPAITASGQATVEVRTSGGSTGVEVAVSGVPSSLAPGSQTNLTVTITNLANTSSSYAPFVEGLPEGWTGTFDRSSVTLGPGAQTDITLTITVSPTAAAGAVTFRVSAVGGSGADVASVNVTVANVRALRLILPATLGPVAPGQTLRFNLTVENLGNAEELVQLTGTFAGGSISFALPASQVPGHATRQMEVTLVVAAGTAAGSSALSISGTTTAQPAVTATGQSTVEVSASGTAPLAPVDVLPLLLILLVAAGGVGAALVLPRRRKKQ